MKTDNTPKAVQDCHDLLLWIIPLPDQIPRNRRFTLGERIESGILQVLELLAEAAYSRGGKAALLQHANLQLMVCRCNTPIFDGARKWRAPPTLMCSLMGIGLSWFL